VWRYNYEAACLCHSYKGTTWKKHKYIAKKNGRYIYNGLGLIDLVSLAKETHEKGEALREKEKQNQPPEGFQYYDPNSSGLATAPYYVQSTTPTQQEKEREKERAKTMKKNLKSDPNPWSKEDIQTMEANGHLATSKPREQIEKEKEERKRAKRKKAMDAGKKALDTWGKMVLGW